MEEKNNTLADALDELLPRWWWRRGPRRHPDNGAACVVLHKLYHHGGITPGELRELLDVTGARVTAILNELEGKGLISRGPVADDKRSVAVTLTDAGRQAVEDKLALRRQRAQRIVDRLGAAEAETLVRLLRAVRELDGECGDKI